MGATQGRRPVERALTSKGARVGRRTKVPPVVVKDGNALLFSAAFSASFAPRR
jgi:hypothetical protein